MKTPTQPTPEVAAGVTTPGMIEIFRAGTHTAMSGKVVTVTEADLADIAAGYDPAMSEAPLVIGHPKLDAPAYGWVHKVVAKGKSLFAEPHQVDPAFAELQNAGKYKKRSASFMLPDAANNPTPGKFYLRHVGFLGAAPPAVKGLQDHTFADAGENLVEFAVSDKVRWGFAALADIFRGLRDRMIETDGLDKAQQAIPDYQIDYLREAGEADADTPALAYADPPIETEPMTDKTAEFAAREQKLAEDAAALAAREQKIADAEKKAARDEAVSFADALVAAGKLLPRQQPGVVELLLALPADTSLSFADGDATVEKPAATVLRELLDGLPEQVNFSEKSRAVVNGDSVSFAAPAGAMVDPSRIEVLEKAHAHLRANPGITFVEAVRAVGG